MTPIAAVLIACADCSLSPSGGWDEATDNTNANTNANANASGNEKENGNNLNSGLGLGAVGEEEDSVADAKLLLKQRQLVVDSSDNIAFWLFCHLVANVLPSDFYAPFPTPMHGLIVEISVTMVRIILRPRGMVDQALFIVGSNLNCKRKCKGTCKCMHTQIRIPFAATVEPS